MKPYEWADRKSECRQARMGQLRAKDSKLQKDVASEKNSFEARGSRLGTLPAVSPLVALRPMPKGCA